MDFRLWPPWYVRTMAKKVQAMVKLQIPAGKATPAPPVGTALGPHGVNIMDFCKNFNAKTAKDDGLIIPVVVTIYADRSYTFITKTPPASVLLKKVANLAKGSAEPNRNKVGHGDGQAGRGHRQAEDARPELPGPRGGGEDGARHGAVDGHRRRRIETDGSGLPGSAGFRRLLERPKTREPGAR